MSAADGGGGPRQEGPSNGKAAIESAGAARRRAGLVGGLRRFATAPQSKQDGRQNAQAPAVAGPPPRGEGETCDLCGTSLPPDHRHLLQLEERRIDCSCEPCWAMRSGDTVYRPVGTRTAWLPDFDLSGERWASFAIPIGLTFFMRSSTAKTVVALYPSPAGATESELDLGSWEALVADNPVLQGLEADSEGLVVNRLTDPHQYAIAPIDQCYALVGLVKSSWEGISGGSGLEKAIAGFFDGLRQRAAA